MSNEILRVGFAGKLPFLLAMVAGLTVGCSTETSKTAQPARTV